MKKLPSLIFAAIAICFSLLGISNMNISLQLVLFISLLIMALLIFVISRNNFQALRRKPGYLAVFSIGLSVGIAGYYFFKMFYGN